MLTLRLRPRAPLDACLYDSRESFDHAAPNEVVELLDSDPASAIQALGGFKHIVTGIDWTHYRESTVNGTGRQAAWLQQVRDTLAEHDGHPVAAARALGIDHSTIWRIRKREGW